MSSITVAYVIRIATLASLYRFCVEHERMDEWPRYAKMALNVRHPRSVASLLNWTYSNDAVTAPSNGDFRNALFILNDRRNKVSATPTAYVNEDALAWHVYIEDCQLTARPIWYKPPGRTLGMYLGADPVADVLDYYERRGRQVLRALEDQLKEWESKNDHHHR